MYVHISTRDLQCFRAVANPRLLGDRDSAAAVDLGAPCVGAATGLQALLGRGSFLCRVKSRAHCRPSGSIVV